MVAYIFFNEKLVNYAEKYRGTQAVIMHELEAYADVTLEGDGASTWTIVLYSLSTASLFIMDDSEAIDVKANSCVAPDWKSMRFARTLFAGAKYRSYTKMIPAGLTPTPHRFLIPKRTASQRAATPKPLASGSQQFHATPRFSLHSTPREPPALQPSSTPARPATFARQRQTEDINDVIDSSPPDVQPSKIFRDSIEVESIPSSSFAAAAASDHGFHVEESDPEHGAPFPKRRRLSVSSVVEDEDEPTLPWTDPLDEIRAAQSDDEHLDNPDDFESTANSDAPESPGVNVQQPTFQRAPRFKPVERPEGTTHDPLPDAFSPRRRGTKDVPGGLAAQVRDWLMDIESNTGSKRDGDFVARISVEEFRHGQSMVLVKGHIVPDDSSTTQHRATVPSLQVMLAGEGRLLDLARRNEVIVGALVAIAKPVWEINLGPEGRWAVACDWVVL
ncbi:hypothetical protein PFICI_06056 [Pestalotiopsis fici W106-1]|uniref:Uncharacterized protein n=1 Tax=Pestalotiopsis fici (strain W106-1 / CGMCC3.15140) TaxID=1229662 RepID=W3X4W9_PESFW|nr:uncharacterized protein PFICI_06056 [Pestalotiopsis fici W106-1]ETS81054.1 hypothetical protein PFICI_06056 [Pestalotiopsis fici W106-1]